MEEEEDQGVWAPAPTATTTTPNTTTSATTTNAEAENAEQFRRSSSHAKSKAGKTNRSPSRNGAALSSSSSSSSSTTASGVVVVQQHPLEFTPTGSPSSSTAAGAPAGAGGPSVSLLSSLHSASAVGTVFSAPHDILARPGTYLPPDPEELHRRRQQSNSSVLRDFDPLQQRQKRLSSVSSSSSSSSSSSAIPAAAASSSGSSDEEFTPFYTSTTTSRIMSELLEQEARFPGLSSLSQRQESAAADRRLPGQSSRSESPRQWPVMQIPHQVPEIHHNDYRHYHHHQQQQLGEDLLLPEQSHVDIASEIADATQSDFMSSGFSQSMQHIDDNMEHHNGSGGSHSSAALSSSIDRNFSSEKKTNRMNNDNIYYSGHVTSGDSIGVGPSQTRTRNAGGVLGDMDSMSPSSRRRRTNRQTSPAGAVGDIGGGRDAARSQSPASSRLLSSSAGSFSAGDFFSTSLDISGSFAGSNTVVSSGVNRSSITRDASKLRMRRRIAILHHVAANETLQGLSILYGIKIADIKRVNKIFTSESIPSKPLLIFPLEYCRPDSQIIEHIDDARKRLADEDAESVSVQATVALADLEQSSGLGGMPGIHQTFIALRNSCDFVIDQDTSSPVSTHNSRSLSWLVELDAAVDELRESRLQSGGFARGGAIKQWPAADGRNQDDLFSIESDDIASEAGGDKESQEAHDGVHRSLDESPADVSASGSSKSRSTVGEKAGEAPQHHAGYSYLRKMDDELAKAIKNLQISPPNKGYGGKGKEREDAVVEWGAGSKSDPQKVRLQMARQNSQSGRSSSSSNSSFLGRASVLSEAIGQSSGSSSSRSRPGEGGSTVSSSHDRKDTRSSASNIFAGWQVGGDRTTSLARTASVSASASSISSSSSSSPSPSVTPARAGSGSHSLFGRDGSNFF